MKPRTRKIILAIVAVIVVLAMVISMALPYII